MFEVLGSAAMLVHMASLLYVIAFIIRDQLMLRILVLVATALYIGYYYFVPATPLWDAIAWSAVLGLANVWVMVGIILERTTYRMNNEEKRLFGVFDTLSPGEFRKLLKITQWHKSTASTELTQEGKEVDRLICVMDGEIEVLKQQRRFQLSPVAFIGEVAFFRQIPATATTQVGPGSLYVSWPSAALRDLQANYPGIRIAMYERLNRDMADKVAAS